MHDTSGAVPAGGFQERKRRPRRPETGSGPMTGNALLTTLLATVLLLSGCTSNADSAPIGRVGGATQELEMEHAVNVHYLEIVTPDVDRTCEALAKAHGVTFGEPIAGLGNARTASLEGGGRIGVRAPMRETEDPVVRPYLRVEDIEAAVAALEAAGAEIAMGPTAIPGQGRFAILVLGGIQHGLWEL